MLAGEPDAERILFLEHDPVLTLGRHAAPGNVTASAAELARAGIAVEPSTRGGDVTAHGPGQLVIYPIVRLERGVVHHVTAVAQAITDELRARGVDARCSRDPVGVFVGAAKIAACGVHVSRRVAIHGWALNVTDEPLALFRMIVPCGLAHVPVTSMATLGAHVEGGPQALAASLATRIAARFEREAIGYEGEAIVF